MRPAMRKGTIIFIMTTYYATCFLRMQCSCQLYTLCQCICTSAEQNIMYGTCTLLHSYKVQKKVPNDPRWSHTPIKLAIVSVWERKREGLANAINNDSS